MKKPEQKVEKDIPEMFRCTLCPRACKRNRSQGERGFCGESDTVRIARAALHRWEEPCISGTRGSGAVFFSGCVLRCVFCQNHSLADSSVGREVSSERLSDIFLELQAQGANNINLVTPTHFVMQLVTAIERAKNQGLRLPIVYNTGGYETAETLKRLEGLVDVYLPDFKYMSSKLAKRYSFAEDYPQVVKAALSQMVSQVGPIQWEDEPFSEKAPVHLMKRGVIVRHLMLPGLLQDSKDVVQYLHETYGDSIYISLMNQYTPMPGIGEHYPELNRRIRKHSYEKLIEYALSIGVKNAFIQEGNTAKESFIPAFDYEGV